MAYSTETYEVKRGQPDDKVLEICREAVPDMDEQAKVAAKGLDTTPAEAIKKMMELISNDKYGLGFLVAVGAQNVINPLIALLNGDELATTAAHLLYSLARWKDNAVAIAKAGGIPPLVTMHKTNPQYNIVIGGPAAGCLKRIASHHVSLKAAVVNAGGMEALVTGFRKTKMEDDEDEVYLPINTARVRIMKEISEYEAEVDETDTSSSASSASAPVTPLLPASTGAAPLSKDVSLDAPETTGSKNSGKEGKKGCTPS